MGPRLREVPSARLRPGRYQSFIIRIWSRGEAGEVTHGEIVDVATHRSAHFRSLPTMLTFMLRALKAPSAPAPAPSDGSTEER